MRQASQKKQRKCEHCDMTFEMIAAEIKAHAERCVQNPKNKGIVIPPGAKWEARTVTGLVHE